MKRVPATPSSAPSPAPAARRQALLRAGLALAAALALGVLGLVVGERGDGRSAARGGADRASPSAPSWPPAAPEAPSAISSAALAPAVTSRSASAPLAPAPAAAVLPSSEPDSMPAPGAANGSPAAATSASGAPGAAAGSMGTDASPEASAPAPADGLLLPAAALRPGGPGYRIQLGVFGDSTNALKLHQRLAAEGYPAHIQSRVVVGPFADRAAAEKARQALRQAGLGGGVLVAPERQK